MIREKLLIVEDEKIIALDLQKRLEKFKYQVVGLATSGEEAIEKAHELLPDIILMDIMLNGQIDGIEAATRINKKLHIPVIFLTAYADEKTLERAKVAEPFGYILKPFKEKELNTTIDIALYKHRIDKELKKQERWSSAILHSIGDGIIATDRENRITFMNPVAELITGWEEKSVCGQPIYEILPVFEEKSKNKLVFPEISDNGKEASEKLIKNSVLLNRKNEMVPVEGSIATIRDRNGIIEGQVIAMRDISEKRKLSATINYQARHDGLTGLYNRTTFSKTLTELIITSYKNDTKHALLYIDIDGFRLINDTAGHEAGDELLLETTSIIKSLLRGSDICARIGGDEFGILLRDSSLNQAQIIAGRLHQKLTATKLSWGDKVFNIHSSIGLVVIDNTSENIHTVLAAADEACSLAKDEGGKRIKFYEHTNTLFKKRQGEKQWVSQMTRALEENRFALYFQNITPLKEGDNGPDKCEILIRMIDDQKNIILPAQFIPAAEKYNFMPQIDRWVITESLKIFKSLSLTNGGRAQIFSINLSPQSIADENLQSFIYEQFEKFEVDPKFICFEITETAAISNMATAGRLIRGLKDLGCTFALDDFGSGFSSFNYLKTMPIDYLKIDGSFVKDMDINPVNSAMVEAMNTIGHIMGVKTIAEFVENSTIKSMLMDLNVDFAQGFELSIPGPVTGLFD